MAGVGWVVVGCYVEDWDVRACGVFCEWGEGGRRCAWRVFAEGGREGGIGVGWVIRT